MMTISLAENDQSNRGADTSYVSPRTVAKALGISESTVKRWCDRGELPSHRTVGGHRKLPLSGVIDFVRSQSMTMPHPEVLGIPVRGGRIRHESEDARKRFEGMLLEGDRRAIEEFLVGLYLGGVAPARICDDMIATALHQIGSGWESGDIEVYEEHRAVELIRQALVSLSSLLLEPEPKAPLAVAATMTGDRYTIGLEMCVLVLRQRRWRTQLLGPDHPLDTLKAAVARIRPRLFCLGINVIDDEEQFVTDYLDFYEHAHQLGVAVVIGGQALTSELRGRLRYTSLCEDMSSLADMADGMWMAREQQG